MVRCSGPGLQLPHRGPRPGAALPPHRPRRGRRARRLLPRDDPRGLHGVHGPGQPLVRRAPRLREAVGAPAAAGGAQGSQGYGLY